LAQSVSSGAFWTRSIQFMGYTMRTVLGTVAVFLLFGLPAGPALGQAPQPYVQTPQTAQPVPPPQAVPPAQPMPQAQPLPQVPPESRFSTREIVEKGHNFFGTVSRELASLVERATTQWGQPNGYILGEEGSGAFIAGLRYGEGTLYTKNAGDLRVYWQGPTVGFDWGGDGARTMMLVYNLPTTSAIYQRFAGIAGSAYLVGGFGATALTANDVVVVPIRSGLGLRLGANIGYLKFTPEATWNPF
jgi:hypothetical protein